MYNERRITESAICDVPCEKLYEQSLDAARIRPPIYKPVVICPDGAAAVRPGFRGQVSEILRSYRRI